ncbi:MAG: DUF3015 family protein [SAR324 cluster bacterium]|nr:DUF3015 family protein [SAR324 cluster bacterium]MBF0349645.1 DUF3015 family protein [SAR324 cluster bacterium]
MKLIISTFLLMVCMSVAVPLFARDGSDGCGMGWDVTEEKSFLGTSTRGTTNATFSPTFSMTSGTSGCDKHSIVRQDARGIHYAEANFSNLKMEIPQGNGEFLFGFAQVLGCGDVTEMFGTVMQKNYEKIYSSEQITPVEMYQNVLQQIRNNDALSGSCRVI